MPLKLHRHIFLAPDNGLLTAIFQTEKIMHCVSITNERVMLPALSSTFHGRDIFSPAAAHLASGFQMQELGEARKTIGMHKNTSAGMPEHRTTAHHGKEASSTPTISAI